jgi:hypothetical protein
MMPGNNTIYAADRESEILGLHGSGLSLTRGDCGFGRFDEGARRGERSMLTLRVITGEQVETIDTFEGLQEALDDVRSSWMEDGGEGSPVYTVADETDQVLAIVFRSADCAEVAIAMFTGADRARVERHRCTYMLDWTGRYDGTRVTCCESGVSKVFKPFASRVR